MVYNYFIISPSSCTQLLTILMIIFSSSPHLIQTNDYSPDHICFSNSKNYTQVFGDNLNNLLTNLSSNTYPTGFWNGSSGQAPDQAYALAICRGDLISTPRCRSCVSIGSKEITRICPASRAAIVWYDDCYLWYADYNFFGRIKTDPNILVHNADRASNGDVYAVAVMGLMSKLSRNASDTTNEYMYASGDAFEPVENVTISGTAQCSGDLSHDDCKECLLDNAIPELWSIAGYVGGRFLSASCVVRFQNFTFIDEHRHPNYIKINKFRDGSRGSRMCGCVAFTVFLFLLLSYV